VTKSSARWCFMDIAPPPVRALQFRFWGFTEAAR
jgi:hypothetical protein